MALKVCSSPSGAGGKGGIFLFLNDWAAIMTVSQNAVTYDAPLPLNVDNVFAADPGGISARGGFMIASQSLRINSPQLAQRPLV